ncbi:saccharopine dehydrogenase C-terminal domain-containing protein [Enhydrobacter sp.]|jgi:homospermidine synthase|uniref:homospermidine synthase n=1 Tax=Enhydrobacter sp. TaxID=1894999 RepID=UPI00262E735B|nr:saccharopine dehydrogenase C-terminal domain-containing protein [Enhydrobacter sp.]WIM10604.1 MAG: Homospermidine synthase [Enhydrobacter sp.]
MARKAARKTASRKYLDFKGRMVMIGFGSIGHGVLPLILRHIGIKPSQITILAEDDRGGSSEIKRYGIEFVRKKLTRANYRQVLTARVGKGDFVVNLSVEVSSMALVELCQEKGAHYIDTCIEPWPGGYTDPNLSVSLRSNYALRESMLKIRPKYRGGPTAVIAHGANPGLVSHFVKRALLDLAKGSQPRTATPTSREGWAKLAQRLGVKVIHVAERDTQVSPKPKEVGEFVNTWSIDGFVAEGCQPAEMGWGTHEKSLPPDGRRHTFGCEAAIYLNRPGLLTRVRTWTPLEGPFHGFIITHNESISIADLLTLRDGRKVVYRPTVHYAYHPCDQAIMSMHEIAGKGLSQQKRQRLIVDEIRSGWDELGVLLMGHKKGVYWYGSQLDIHGTRRLVPYNNATSLQVCAPVLSGIVWALENPDRGIVEADDMDFERNLEICLPYLGPVVGRYGDWTPLQDRGVLFPEDVDVDDPWQFKNFRVI